MTGSRRIAGEDATIELAGVIGERAALDLARHFGGLSIYVPKAIGEHHPIHAAIGGEAAGRLAEWAGGGEIYVAKQVERRARVRELRRQALTRAQIARETGYSARHVGRLLREHDDACQLDLFDDR